MFRNYNGDRPVSVRRTLAPSNPEHTWDCHVCGEKRPDKRISVFSREIMTEMGVRIRTNTRHCNDRKDCIANVRDVNLIMMPERESEYGRSEYPA